MGDIILMVEEVLIREVIIKIVELAIIMGSINN